MENAPTCNANESAQETLILPDLPTRINTVVAAVLADLLEGQQVSHLDCWRRHGSSRLSHAIWLLRGDGWPIRTNDADVDTSDGRVATIGLYMLDAWAINATGERGNEFIRAVREARAARRVA